MNQKAKFWWWVRDIWHMPSFWHGGCKSPLWWEDTNRYMIFWYQRNYKAIIRLCWQHTLTACNRSYWAIRWWQPFRCNGNCGGWRTKFCDFLEDKARSYDD